MIVHLVDGTYELFRHFYGLRRFTKGVDRPYGAVVGVLQTVLQMIDHVNDSASRGPSDAYLGVATDHVIESFRNRLWADYKTGAGIEPALPAQNDSRCRRDTRKVRRQPTAHSGPTRARGRCGRRLPRHRWDRRHDRRPAFEPLRSDRKISVKDSRRTTRPRTALQESRDPAH